KQYLSGRYNRSSIVEWCRTHLDLTIEEDALDMIDAESAQASIRKKAKDEAYDTIRTSLGEYIDPEEPPSEWDVGGLLLWARRVFKLSTLTQNQLRKMEPRAIEDALCEAADALYDSVDLTGIAMYLDPQYPYRALADWARTKFNIEADLEELIERPREEITELFDRRVREAYRRREIVYPVEWCLERALAGGSADNAAAAAAIAAWTNGKFNVGWKLEDVQGRSPAELHDTLVKLNEEFFGVRLDREIEQGIAGKDRDAAIEWAKNRMVPPDDYLGELTRSAHEPPIPAELMLRVYEGYERRKGATERMDFEDMLGLAVRMLDTYPEAAAAVRARFHAFTVDEFQDVNPLQ
ncbi:MAG: UvrD-helicase domain-containing protein, partial [candidate division NC10 bacterium]